MHTLALFVHEARHANGWPYTCGNLDSTLDELGAWGVQYYLERWLAAHSDPSFFTPADGDPDSQFYPYLYMQSMAEAAEGVRVARFCGDSTPSFEFPLTAAPTGPA